MSDFDSVVSRYLAVWNETDPAARRKRIDDLFADDVRYVDPMAAVTGRAALDGLIGAVQQQFPGLNLQERFRILRPLELLFQQPATLAKLLFLPGMAKSFLLKRLRADSRDSDLSQRDAEMVGEFQRLNRNFLIRE